jgi:alpha-L-rhamnosidase
VDSPTRERSSSYEGDNYIHQLAQAAVDGDSALAQFSLEYTVTEMAAVKATVPVIDFEELAPVAALAQYEQTGDPAAATALYPLLRELLPTRYLAADGLVDLPPDPLVEGRPVAGVPELVDWPASERDGFVFARQNTVVNALAYAAYAAMAQVAAVAGDPAGARADAGAAARIRSAMRAMLYDPRTGAFRDGAGVAHEAVQSSVYAVAFGVASPAQARTAAAVIARRGMACSVYCAAYLLEALYDGGQPAAALRLMTADTTDSWRHMIALGAGSTMEAWDPALKANLSYSHVWAASPAFVIPQYLFGLRPLSPGWATVLIDPQPASLTAGSAVVPTPRGPVSVAFTAAGGHLGARVDVPATATAEVALPGVRAGQRVWVDGSPVTARPLAEGDTADGTAGGDTVSTGSTVSTGGGVPAGADAGLAVVPVGSGWHQVATAR